MRCLFELFSNQAKEDGFLIIANFFLNLADLKKELAKWSYLLLKKIENKNSLKIPSSLFGDIPSIEKTYDNLTVALREQLKAWREIYPNFAEIAHKEALNEISSRLIFIAERERKAYEILQILDNAFDNKSLLKKESIPLWECQGCGFQISIENLPEDWLCPSCGQLKSYFQKKYLSFVQDEQIIWECMECGDQVIMEELPNNWKCIICGKPKSYFKRKSLDLLIGQKSSYLIKSREQAFWYCPSCGNKAKINLPLDFKCPKCGYKMD